MLRWNKIQDSVTRTSRRLSPSAAPRDVTPLSDLCRERKGAMLPPCCCAVAGLQLAPDEQREWRRGDGAACLLQRPHDRGEASSYKEQRRWPEHERRAAVAVADPALKASSRVKSQDDCGVLEPGSRGAAAHLASARLPGSASRSTRPPPIIIVGDTTTGPARGGPRPARRAARPYIEFDRRVPR